MLISPVHALVQVWQVRGGHTCNFPCENTVFHAKVPLFPEQLDVIIMHWKTQSSTSLKSQPLMHFTTFELK